MKRQDKKLFDERFNTFFSNWIKGYNLEGISEKEIEKISTTVGAGMGRKTLNRDYYYQLMYGMFEKLSELISGLTYLEKFASQMDGALTKGGNNFDQDSIDELHKRLKSIREKNRGIRIDSSLSVDESLEIIFKIPKEMLSIHKMMKWRKKPAEKYFLEVIEYYLSNETSEYDACNKIMEKYPEVRKKYKNEVMSFKNTFREWYKNFDNKLRNPIIFEYLRTKKEREQKKFRKIS